MRNIRKSLHMILLCIVFLFVCACSKAPFHSLTPDEAEDLIRTEKCVIVDTRSAEEYEQSHIKNAVNIPFASLQNMGPEELPDTKTVILIYGETDELSEAAAERLSLLGYSNVYLFGGYDSWKGERQ